jgi:hypothetical protein
MKNIGRFLYRQATKKPQLDDTALLRINTRQRIQGIVNCHDRDVPRLRRRQLWIERHSHCVMPSALSSCSPACVLHQNATYQMGGNAEEMRAALPLHIALVDELKVGVVHERRCLECVTRPFPAQMMVSEAAELDVHGVNQVVPRLLISPTPCDKQLRDV